MSDSSPNSAQGRWELIGLGAKGPTGLAKNGEYQWTVSSRLSARKATDYLNALEAELAAANKKAALARKMQERLHFLQHREATKRPLTPIDECGSCIDMLAALERESGEQQQ